MAVILTVTTTPTSFASGTFGAFATAANTGIYRFTITPDAASSTYTGGAFHAIFGQSHGGLWLNDANLELYTEPGDALVFSRAMTWSAAQTITITIDTRSGTRGVTIAGATTGNGTFSFATAGPYISTAETLWVGVFNTTLFPFAGDVSDVDDVGGISRTCALDVAVGAATAAVPVRERTAAVSVAVGAATAAAVTGHSASMSIAVGASTSATRTLVRSAVPTIAVDSSTEATVDGFGPGVSTSGLWPFGNSAETCTIPGGYLPPGGGGADVDGRTPAQINTEVTGSTFYVCVARPVATVDKTITDNKGNTYTSLLRQGYQPASDWENEIAVCVDGDGGTDHEITTDSVEFNETTFAFDEIKNCAYLADHGTSYTVDGTTQISPTGIDLKGPGWVYVDWFGDGPVSGAEGSVWTVTAQDEGPTVGSQWQVVDSRIVNHTNGWIQWKRWRRFYAAATTNIRLQLATLNPSQGARWYAAAFMEANITDAVAAITVAVGAASAATRALARSADQAIAVGASTAASVTGARSAAIAIDVGAATSAIRTVPRSAALALAVGATSDALAIRARAAALAIAVGADTSATASAAGDRTVALSIAVGAAIAAAVSHQRTAALSVAVGAATAVIGDEPTPLPGPPAPGTFAALVAEMDLLILEHLG